MALLADILEQAKAQSLAEAVAVVAAVLYLLLAIRESIACWFFAAVSAAIYVWLFFDTRLYMESLLNAFYFAMAGYGWTVWQGGRHRGSVERKPVVTWPVRRHLVAIAVVTALSAANGYLLLTYSDAAFPYIDSLIAGFAIWSTFLVAQKVLENWWYWLVIDTAAVFVYWSRDLQLTSALFVVYILMIPFGFRSWRRSMRQEIRPVSPYPPS